MSGNILRITNFKSIKNLEINCGRINVFIGEPNTGKSNILEALGFLSYFIYHEYGNINHFVRIERTLNLFYDELIDNPIEITFGQFNASIQFKQSKLSGVLMSNAEQYQGQSNLQGDYNVINSHNNLPNWQEFPIRYYKYIENMNLTKQDPEFLLPAGGSNLISIILANKAIKKFVDETLRPYGLRMIVKPQENKLEIIKLMEDILISYPYYLLSDTLKRIIFHMAAILSNKNATLIFEEPESHAFPYHTKYLAEKIALDNGNNEYFIATHNPYFLLTLLEKTPKNDIQIFLTYFEDYQTKVKPLSDNQKEELLRMDTDIFFQLEELLSV